MNTEINKPRKTYRASALIAISAMVMAAMFTGCGKKKGDQSVVGAGGVLVVPPNAVYPTCSGCPTATQFLVSALGKVYSGGQLKMDIALEFFADSSVYANYQNQTGYSGGLGYYQGVVVPRGKMTIHVNNTPVGCNLPTGQYELVPTQAGQWSGKSFGGVVMQAVGPATLTVSFPNNFLLDAIPPVQGPYGTTYPYRMANFVIVTPQGTNCSLYLATHQMM